jgi:uncharacterized protein
VHIKKPVLLRKRYIPYETVDISNDELLYRSDELLVTRWKAIKPRNDFYCGISYAFLNRGFKLGRFYDIEGNFLYWYGDIIDVLYDMEKDAYTFDDLLIDIKIMPDGILKVLDTDELAEALETGLISSGQACRALRTLDMLLDMVYSGDFPPEECKRLEFGIV